MAQTFDSLFHFPVSEGGLAQQWMRLAEILADALALFIVRGALPDLPAKPEGRS